MYIAAGDTLTSELCYSQRQLTPLHAATYQGHYDVVKTLMEANADKDKLNEVCKRTVMSTPAYNSLYICTMLLHKYYNYKQFSLVLLYGWKIGK